MGKYGQAAILAMELIEKDQYANPKVAWEQATEQIFGKGTSSQCKGCPRGAFLGLCEAGLIKGVAAGEYCNSEHNKSYALKAVELLKKQPELATNINQLWYKITKGEKAHNGQMDVVISLWGHNRIVR